MRRLIVLAFAAALPSVSHAAEEFPGVFTVQNDSERVTISGSCKPPVQGDMVCEFRRVSVYRPPHEEAQKRIADGVNQLMKQTADQRAKDCASVAELVTALETGVASPAITDKKAFEDSWAAQFPEAKKDTLGVFKALAQFCGTPNIEAATAFAVQSEEIDASTCSISAWETKRTFQLNLTTNKWQSTIQNQDGCGIISYAEFFVPDDGKKYSLWNYSEKEIVTNPSGTNLFGDSCSTVDQSENLYKWQVGKLYGGCRYLRISP